MRRARYDAGPHEKAGLFERKLERLGLGVAANEIVLGAGGEQHSDAVVGVGRVADRRGIEIKLPVRHRRRTDEFLDLVVAVAAVLHLKRAPHRVEVVDAVDANQGFDTVSVAANGSCG